MTRERPSNSLRRDGTLGARTPRFRLKPKTDCRGYVDGAWWPRSDDLTTELPSLIAVLSVRRGAISRVMYNLNEWRTTPTEIVTGGRAVQLDGYRGHLSNTVEVFGAKGNKIVLLVVPAHTDPEQAHAIVTAAAASGNVSSVDPLLMISAKDRESRKKRAAARERWNSQGGATSRRLDGAATRPMDHE
jgi:Family of unknown function (DUF5994)